MSAARQLRRSETRLKAIGSEDPIELLRATPVIRSQEHFGVGLGTVQALRDAGYESAADLWDVELQRPTLLRLPYFGRVRVAAIEDWVHNEVLRTEKEAAANSEKRQGLEIRIDELKAELKSRATSPLT